MRTWLILALVLVLLPGPATAQQLTPQDYYTQGEKAFREGKYDEAFNNFSLYCNTVPKDENADYARLFIWIARTRQNHKAEADLELAEALETKWNAPQKSWVSQIAAFFLDQLSEKDFLAAAETPDSETVNQQHCEAWYYIGMKRLLAGDKTAAIDDFNKCLATKETDFTEYAFAQAQLKALAIPATATSDKPPR